MGWALNKSSAHLVGLLPFHIFLLYSSLVPQIAWITLIVDCCAPAWTGGTDAADAGLILSGLWGEGNGAESENKNKGALHSMVELTYRRTGRGGVYARTHRSGWGAPRHSRLLSRPVWQEQKGLICKSPTCYGIAGWGNYDRFCFHQKISDCELQWILLESVEYSA